MLYIFNTEQKKRTPLLCEIPNLPILAHISVECQRNVHMYNHNFNMVYKRKYDQKPHYGTGEKKKSAKTEVLNGGAGKQFIGNTQLLRNHKVGETSVKWNVKIVIPEKTDLANIIWDNAGIEAIGLSTEE